MAVASNLHSVNGKDLYDIFGVTVESGQAEFDTPFPVKPSLKHNWPGEEGQDIDVSSTLKRDAKEITLKCNMVLFSKTDFYTKKDAFEAEMRKSGYQTWHVYDHGKSYSVKYEGSKNGKKPFSRYEGAAGIVHSFDMTLTVQPTLQPAFNSDVIINLNGVYYGTAACGSTFNVVTNGGGVTPTVSITGVAVQEGRNIVISASGHPDYAIQYSIDGGATYQSANIFLNVPNGTYTGKIRARLVGTNITASWPGSVVVNYTPPAAPETLTISNVTSQDNQITILATKANTTRSIQYSIDNNTWQASNVFTVPNGTYNVFYARLAGPGDIVNATYNKTIVINYAAPVTSFNTVLYPGGSLGSVTFQGAPGTEFHYNSPLPSDPPFPASMSIRFQYGTEIALIDFNQGAIGQPCAIKYNGTLYRTTFQNSDFVTVG